MKVDARFLTGQGPEIFTGNELLVKGALEAEGGMHLLAGYPGSPVAGFFDALAQVKDLLNEHGIRAAINNNEALAAAMLNGSQLAGCRGMIVMKSVGVHVAADALAIGNMGGANPDGGAIVVYGDDPWSDSTQVACDSRFISRHLFIPTIEPSTPQEVKDYVDLSLRLSRRSELYAGYVLTTNLADGGGTVQCRPNQFPTFNTRQKLTLRTAEINLNTRVLLPPRTWWQEASMTSRFQRAMDAARELGINQILYAGQGKRRPVGFISSGLAQAYLLQALRELDLLGELPVLKLGMSYPVDPELVRQLAGQCERIVVVEERRSFVEEQVQAIVLRDRQQGLPAGAAEVWGKNFPDNLPGLPEIRGLHPSMLIERLARLMDHLAAKGATGLDERALQSCRREEAAVEQAASVDTGSLPGRIPTFCPGCPHRDSANVCLEIKRQFMDGGYMRRAHKRGPVDLLFHGDTGCYTLLMFPPNTDLMHDYSGMGLGAGTGSGIDPFITNKQVVFMGDSTFFHSGLIAISQAIKLGQDITFIILDNRTTAMTGHQPTPGQDYDILGKPTAAQSIDDILRGMGGESTVRIIRANPEQRSDYRRLLEATFLADGVKIIIADKECGITRIRRQRRAERAIAREKGFLPSWQHMNINQEICRFCLACAEFTGCPGLRHTATDYGPKMDTDITWCVNDGACQRIGACSAFERVTIKRKAKPRSRMPELGLDSIPEPAQRPRGELWRCGLVGVGGMGIGLATQIMVRAGHKEGYRVLFVDSKGMAIRNGGTVSQVTYTTAPGPLAAIIPFGKADLLIGMDVLEAARALDPAGRVRFASPQRTVAVINTDKIDTVTGLMGGGSFRVEELERLIRANTRAEDGLTRDLSRLSEKYLGSKLYANIMMLGFAFQKGLIPVSMHSMAWAIKDTIHAETKKNMYAFHIGRKLVEQPDLFQGPPRRLTWKDMLEDKCRYLIRRYRSGQNLADLLRTLASETLEHFDGLDDLFKRDLAVRMYDCLRWGGLEYARQYAQAVVDIHRREVKGVADLGLLDCRIPSELAQTSINPADFPATRAAMVNLAAAMLIKDPVFLAELATSPEKLARDREKYNVNLANGDRILYRHLMRPEFHIGKRKIALDLALPSWPLQALKRMGFLRRLGLWQMRQRQHLTSYRLALAAFHFDTPGEYERAVADLANPLCMDCRRPTCQDQACPLGSPVPEWVGLAVAGQWRAAAELLHRHNNFPEFTSLICPAPCQNVCKQGLAGYPVQARQIERDIVERAFQEGWVKPARPAAASGKRVAIVGSGPAALAAAQQLARAGHEVNVYEKDPLPGGLLRYGVPEFRLAKSLLDRRLEQLSAEGVRFHTGCRIGTDVAWEAIRAQHHALLLANGSTRPRELKVSGREHAGICQALDYLRGANDAVAAGREPEAACSAKGKVVAVIGGGETGNDCVETALAQGAAAVYQLEIMPAATGNGQKTMNHAGRLQQRWCVETTAFKPVDGRLSLCGREVKWLNSPQGKLMQPLAGSEFRLDIDMAVLALGFEARADDDMVRSLGLGVDCRGRLLLEASAATAEGVFVAGDAATGAALLAKAIATGRQAAERIDRFLAP